MNLLAVLFASVFFMLPRMTLAEDVTDQDTVEEEVCYNICTETHESFRAIPEYYFMKKCIPRCLARLECLPIDRLDPDGPWECRDLGPR